LEASSLERKKHYPSQYGAGMSIIMVERGENISPITAINASAMWVMIDNPSNSGDDRQLEPRRRA
jgi:hypothetical protein